MSNPYIPNSAQIPNIIFDYWMARLTPGEFKVLMAIARKTYGWNKARDMISLRQIEEITGLARKSVYQMIEALIEKGLVIKIKSKTEWGDDAPNLYEINIECKEGVENCEGGGRELRYLPVGTSGTQGVGTSGTPQNTIYTKHTIQKREEAEPPPAPSSKKVKQKTEKNAYRDNVHLTEGEYQKLLKQYGKKKLDWMLDHLHSKKGANGYSYESDYHVLLPTNWVNGAYKEEVQKGKIERVSVEGNENAMLNKLICEYIESKLQDRFSSSIFFAASPTRALLCSNPKDFKKEYDYEAYDNENLKAILIKDLEMCFPGSREILKNQKSKSVEKIINDLSDQFKLAGSGV